nr:helix-turn-helix transcriptional regulator [uncultured Anaerobutyricum sp.]
METFGEKLKTLRIMHNLSQRELGQRMGGIKQQTIAQYEKKEKAPKLETVLKIADALGINPNVFYDDLSQEEHENILETKAKRADKDNFNNVIEILANINDVFYWYAEDEDLYFFGTNEKVFALKPKSIRAIQKAIEGFVPSIVEQLKIIEPLYELLIRRFGNIKNFIEDLKEDSTLLGEFCKEMSVSLCMDVDDVEQKVLIYLQIYCEEKRMSVKVITTQGEELIINPEV